MQIEVLRFSVVVWYVSFLSIFLPLLGFDRRQINIL